MCIIGLIIWQKLVSFDLSNLLSFTFKSFWGACDPVFISVPRVMFLQDAKFPVASRCITCHIPVPHLLQTAVLVVNVEGLVFIWLAFSYYFFKWAIIFHHFIVSLELHWLSVYIVWYWWNQCHFSYILSFV